MIKALIFDWGNTIMKDFGHESPMWQWQLVEYISGDRQVLEEIRGNYQLVIASNAGHSDTSDMIKALDRIDAYQYFQYFFTSKDLGYAKPDKRFFDTIKDHLSLASTECMMIGDNYRKDIKGAREAGMKTVLLLGNSDKGSYPEADHIIYSMPELLTVLKAYEL